MDSLPVNYRWNPNRSAWFDREVFRAWFHDDAVPEIYKDQIERQKIARENVKALILTDNAPAHPSCDELCSKDGNIKVMFLPPNTTSVIQPMDQGVIECCKRYYRNKLMNECYVVVETEEDMVEDTRGARTLENLKNYNVRNAVFNLAEAWNQVSVLTLANGWKKLLNDTDVSVDFTGFEPEDFLNAFHRAGAMDVREDVVEWLDVDADDPGYHHETEEEIAASVATTTQQESEEESEEEDVTEKVKLSLVRKGMDDALAWIDQVDDREAQRYYSHLRDFRAYIIQLQHAKEKQVKIHDFFKPIPRRGASAAHEPIASTSSDSSALNIAYTSTDTE